jgi:hypothetical protein
MLAQNRLHLVCRTLKVFILLALIAVCYPSFAADLAIEIEAYIDGRDQLIISRNTLQWHHFDWAAVGRYGDANEPTIIRTWDSGIERSWEWIPDWPEPPPAEIRYEAFSSIFTDLRPAFPTDGIRWELTELSVRWEMGIVQQPRAANDYTMIVEFNDNPLSAAAWYHIRLTAVPEPPVADAGPDQTPFVTDTVTLDGSGSSDVGGDTLTFQWSFVSVPAGSAATLSDPTAVNPFFFVDKFGTYVVQLIVNDGTVDSAPDTMTIITQNSPPNAVARLDPPPAGQVFFGDTATLDGSSSSDVDEHPLTFAWSFVSVPAGSAAKLSDSTAEKPTFLVDVVGTYAIQLIVNDGFVDSDPESVNVVTGNFLPIADAGPNQTVVEGETVTLDGSNSSDRDDGIQSYSWVQTAGPRVTLSDGDKVQV